MANTTSAREKIRAAIESWKRKLLDVSKRNKALNFKPAKVSTVTIVEELSSETFRRLYIEEKFMKFRPSTAIAPIAATTVEEDVPSSAIADLDDELTFEGPDFSPYKSGDLTPEHHDEWLQTTSPSEKLDHSLRRLDEQARLSIEEQGVNTLFLSLGMLYYTESKDSEEVYKAPIVLLPVTLKRKSATATYTMEVADDDAIVNPALSEVLKAQYGISVPSLPDSEHMADDYDLQTLFTAVSEAIRDKEGWALKDEIFLAPFSFQKFIMYKDMEAKVEDFCVHRLTQQLVLRSGSQVTGLPSEIREMKLDEEFRPESTYQVVDADSSQLRAIAAIARGYDLVIEGPPGTGKSQTITNLVAQALAVGKSVLFVAEKMAALSVVHDRLVHAGLGEFCLELHSTKINKKAVMSQLSSALNASLTSVAGSTKATSLLPTVRTTLTDYVDALHSPYGSLAISPFAGYGRLGSVIGAQKLNYRGPIDGIVTIESFEEALRTLRDLAAAAIPIGKPADHPWRDATKTLYAPHELDEIEELGREVLSDLDDVANAAKEVEAAFGMSQITHQSDIESALTIGRLIERSPGAPREILESDLWNSAPPQASDLINKGKAVNEQAKYVESMFQPTVLSQSHASDIAYVEDKCEGVLGFMAVFAGKYRAIKQRWISYRVGGYQKSIKLQRHDMKSVDVLLEMRKDLALRDQEAHKMFGTLWRGEASSWTELEEYIFWVTEFRKTCVTHALSKRIAAIASQPSPNVEKIKALAVAGQALEAKMDAFRVRVGWIPTYQAQASFDESTTRVRELVDRIGKGPQWAGFEAARQAASRTIAGESISGGMTGTILFADLPAAFEKAFINRWLAAAVAERPALAGFQTLTHQQRVSEFQKLDQDVLKENRAKLVSELRDRTQSRLLEEAPSRAMPFLRRQLALQRRHAPLRVTMKEAGEAVRAIKPCFMMSPLSVAQLLGNASAFDLVIFDEASQLPTEDAMGAIVRGKQLAVVGDPKQLPPTNFFAVASGVVTAARADDGTPLYDDSESVLEEYMGSGIPMSRLKWHYRSAHESLIAFSNVNFYDSDLYTFPSIHTGTDQYGLQFEFVQDGVYEGKGLNMKEARRVTDEVVAFAKEQLLRGARGEETLSLAVGTFNMRQQLAIQDELEQRRRSDPSIEPFFDRGKDEAFMVKNLENIQGDERDVIFISVTYGKGIDGRIRHNFGPINSENGWRRLNVLTTRARRRMKIFSSMRGDEINPAAATSRGATLLREFLLFAEHGRLESVSASLAADTDSPFELDVYNELIKRGIRVVTQVGSAGYRIDMGILHPDVPGQFICGIECDGVAYHSSETARDRDRLRQQVLEARGWTIHRLWSTDWFKDRTGQIERLLHLIEQSRISVESEQEGDRVARERIRAEELVEAEADAKAAHDQAQELVELLESAKPYVRPASLPYKVTPGIGQFAGSELLMAPDSQLLGSITTIVKTEGPIHQKDLFTRVADMWDTKAGSRIQRRIGNVCKKAVSETLIIQRGEFYWANSGQCPVRSRAGTKIPASRVAPEEYELAINNVLANGHGFSRKQLINEVRSVFGFDRTGRELEEAIGNAIDRLLAQAILGEGAAGIRLRNS